jgi:hypothetical protein
MFFVQIMVFDPVAAAGARTMCSSAHSILCGSWWMIQLQQQELEKCAVLCIVYHVDHVQSSCSNLCLLQPEHSGLLLHFHPSEFQSEA